MSKNSIFDTYILHFDMTERLQQKEAVRFSLVHSSFVLFLKINVFIVLSYVIIVKGEKSFGKDERE